MVPPPNGRTYASACCQHLEPRQRVHVTDAAIDRVLRGVLSAAKRRWPDIVVDPIGFVRHLAQRLPVSESALTAIPKVRSDELYLAYACAEGDARAIAELERLYGKHIDAAVRTVDHPHVERDDLGQIVRLRLLVGGEDVLPAITRYGGAGRLSSWLRVTARRTVLNATRRNVREVLHQHPSRALLRSARIDPEICHLREIYGDAFREAFAGAVQSLTSRERTLLLMSYVQQLRVRAIARMYGVHHATAARWVGAARDALVTATHRHLRSHLRVEDTDRLDSIIALIRSRIAEDVAVVLREPGPPAKTA